MCGCVKTKFLCFSFCLIREPLPKCTNSLLSAHCGGIHVGKHVAVGHSIASILYTHDASAGGGVCFPPCCRVAPRTTPSARA